MVPKMGDLNPIEQRWATAAYDYLAERIAALPAGAIGDRDTVQVPVELYWNALHLPHLMSETRDGKPVWEGQRSRARSLSGYRLMLIPGAWARSLWNRLPQVAHAKAAYTQGEPTIEAPTGEQGTKKDIARKGG